MIHVRSILEPWHGRGSLPLSTASTRPEPLPRPSDGGQLEHALGPLLVPGELVVPWEGGRQLLGHDLGGSALEQAEGRGALTSLSRHTHFRLVLNRQLIGNNERLIMPRHISASLYYDNTQKSS